jgi:DNA (cytosine-5)-methyltransferase 1
MSTSLHRGGSSGVRPRLLDLFCGAGGCAKGYHAAGFDVVGVDISSQPAYPFEFQLDDALNVLDGLLNGDRWSQHPLSDFDAIHASPPCQAYTQLAAVNAKLGRKQKHAKLIAPTRELLKQTGLPYVIENVVGAELVDPVRVCGTSFGLPLRRHRLFESNVDLVGTTCAHHLFTKPKYWTGWRPNGEHRLSTVVQVYGNAGGKHEWPAAMGIDWMTNDEMSEAVPPAYTEWIGRYLMAALTEKAVAA